MDYEFRKQLYKLDDIVFIGNPRAKYTEKDRRIVSAYFQVIRDAERTYNREVR